MDILKLIFYFLIFFGIPYAIILILYGVIGSFISKDKNINTDSRETKKINSETKNSLLPIKSGKIKIDLQEDSARKKLDKEEETRQRISHLEAKLSDIYLSTWDKYHALGDATKIEAMTGIQFEKFVGKLFVSMGYDVTFTSVNNDQGTDLIAKKDNDKTAIQVKRYKKNVGNNAVQEVIAGAQYHDCNKTCVVTNSTFTKPAKDLAKRSKTKLIDGGMLFSLTEEYLKEDGVAYDHDTFIKNKNVILSFFPKMIQLIRSVENEIYFLDKRYGSHKKTDLSLPRHVTKNKPDKCPKCGAAQLADILYGMPADYSKIQEDIKAGLIVLGGCCITENDPKWECTSCNKKI